MAETNFPNGISIPADHVGSVAPIVTATGLRVAAGSAVLSNAGTVDVVTGLQTVLYAQATPCGALSSAGTVGGFVTPTVTIKASGTIMVKGYDQMGTASTAAGTVFWHAIGT